MKNFTTQLALLAFLSSLNTLITPKDPSQIARNLKAAENKFKESWGPNTDESPYEKTESLVKLFADINPIIDLENNESKLNQRLEEAGKKYETNPTEENKAGKTSAEIAYEPSINALFILYFALYADPSDEEKYKQMTPDERSKAIAELDAQLAETVNKLTKIAQEKPGNKTDSEIKNANYLKVRNEYMAIKTKLEQANKAQGFCNVLYS